MGEICEIVVLYNMVSKALELPKLSNKLSLKGSGGELKAKNCFLRQSFIKFLRFSLVFM